MKNNSSYIWGLFYVFIIVSVLSFILGVIVSHGADVNITASNWITAISTLIIAIFTLVLGIVAWKTAESWKEQRKPETTIKLLQAIRAYQNDIDKSYIKISDNLKKEPSKEKCKVYLKEFSDSLVDSLINLEISITEYIIFSPVNKDALLRKEAIVKDLYCILSDIYLKENLSKITAFENKIRRTDSVYGKGGAKYMEKIPDDLILKYVLGFFLRTSFLTTYFMYNRVSGRKIILGRNY